MGAAHRLGYDAESLFDAIRAGAAEQVERILNESPRLAHSRTPDGASTVLFAICNGHPEMAPLLERSGVKLDFWEACAAGRADAVSHGVESEPARVNSFAEDGYPALALAVFFGHEAMARYLLEQGAGVNAAARNPRRATALHAAVARRNARLVGELLAWSADPNATQAGGFTPLDGAAFHGDAEMVELLLAHGADPLKKNEQGKTAADLARERGHDQLAARLSGNT